MKNILENLSKKIKALTKKQKIFLTASSGVLLAVFCVGLGIACFPINNAPIEVDEPSEKIEVVVEEKQEPIMEETVIELQNISFSGTSIEKDLKIKIVDVTGTLVQGTTFKLSVKAQKEIEGEDYIDNDLDGIIHITGMTAGKYIVQLYEMEGFAIAENNILMTVKDKIEYKKVDVKNEIKKESEVNVKKEDALTQKPKEENIIVNTVELLESAKKEELVSKEQVDNFNFTKAIVSEVKREEVILEDTKVTVPEEVVLFAQGGEDSKTFLLELMVADEQQVIRDYEWEIDVEGIISCKEKSGNVVSISSIQKGTATLCLRVIYEEDVAIGLQSKEIKITVTVSDFTDDKTQLQNTDGDYLYLDKEGKLPATLKDYSVATEFYAMRYIGWTEIQGRKYYFDSEYKAVTGMQVIGGVRYIFDEHGVLLETTEQKGVDVSKWNGTIDWNAVANAGIDFAIIRVGYRGYTEGTLIEDPYFKQNIEGATKAGLKVGVYFFTQAITEAEAVEEASMVISLVSGYQLQLPIYFDTEDVEGNGRADKMSVAQRTTIAKAFCETVRNAGYLPGVYASTSWFQKQLDVSALANYDIWVAHYANVCGYKGRYHMWQYTSAGSVPGIKGRVDLNIRYVEVDKKKE